MNPQSLKKGDSELKKLVEDDDVSQHSTSANSAVKVDSIDSVEELSRFKQCSHCSKKIIHDSCRSFVKCDHCSHVVRSSSCKVNVMAKFVIKKAGQEESDDILVRFVMFKEVLEKLLGSIENLEGDRILEGLFSLENFEILYNSEHVVKDVNI